MEATRAMIPIIGFISLATTLFGIYYLRNKENMALIERGINPRESYKSGSLAYLKYGLLLIGVGSGLLCAYIMDVTFTREKLGDPTGLYFSLIGIGGGVGLIISYFIEKKEITSKTGHKNDKPLE